MAYSDADIPELDRKGLRGFAFTTGGVVAALFGVALPWLLGHAFPAWPWFVAATLAVWGLAAPRSLRPVYRGWMRFGLALNRVTTPVVLAVVYYLVFTPTGFAMRLLRRDPMARQRDPIAETYRVPSAKAPREKMERPF